MSSDPFKTFLPQIGDRFSDYKLICKGHEFKVHKLVLHCYSEVFRKIFNGDWKEMQSDANGMQLDDHEPTEIRAMIDYFYNSTYDVPESESDLLFHAKIFKVADFFRVPTLEAAALENFMFECELDENRQYCLQLVRMMKEFPSHQGFENQAMRYVRKYLDDLLDTEAFEQLIKELPKWINDLLKSMHHDMEKTTSRPCGIQPQSTTATNPIMYPGTGYGRKGWENL